LFIFNEEQKLPRAIKADKPELIKYGIDVAGEFSKIFNFEYWRNFLPELS